MQTQEEVKEVQVPYVPLPELNTYHCVHCSQKLFDTKHLLFKHTKLNPSKPCSEYLLDPSALAWYDDSPDFGKKQGAIICTRKNCRAKIGIFSLGGATCECGFSVRPRCFQIFKQCVGARPAK
jgi:hypothetical protein